MSQTVSSRLLCLTRSTLKTGGWDRRRCCVHHQAAEGRHQDDLQLLPACRSQISSGTPQQLGRASTRFSDGLSYLSASLLGKFDGQVCGAALKGIANHFRGVLTEMRVARDLHTVSCTPHRSRAQAGQDRTDLANVLTNATHNGCHVCPRAMKSHTSVLYETAVLVPRLAKSCSAFPTTKVHLRVKQRLFSVFRSSASVVTTGGSAAGSSSLAATVVAGSSVLAVLLIRIHFVKELCVMCRGSETWALLPCGTMRDCTLP